MRTLTAIALAIFYLMVSAEGLFVYYSVFEKSRLIGNNEYLSVPQKTFTLMNYQKSYNTVLIQFTKQFAFRCVRT